MALAVGAGIVVLTTASLILCIQSRNAASGTSKTETKRHAGKTATMPMREKKTSPVVVSHSDGLTTKTRLPSEKKEEVACTIDGDTFKSLLSVVMTPLKPAGKTNLIDPEEFSAKKNAAETLVALSTAEKIHWFGEMMKSDDAETRKAAMGGARLFFSEKAFERQAGINTLSDWKENDSADRIKVLGEVARPTAEEAAKINDMVCTGLTDSDKMVWQEALDTAASFDATACNDLYAYAMTAGNDDVRLAVLENAKSGDPEFMLFLEFAALDVGGEVVRECVSADIKVATGRTFADSNEAFMWYERNKAAQHEPRSQQQ